METISPWTIYWVMQLDTIGVAAVVLSIFGGGALLLLWGFVLTELKSLAGYFVSATASVVWLIVLAAAIFLPSTKTAAAMYLIPAIASNQTIHREAGELYGLAKQALRQVGASDEAKTPEAKE